MFHFAQSNPPVDLDCSLALELQQFQEFSDRERPELVQQIVRATIPECFSLEEAELSTYCAEVTRQAMEAILVRWYERLDPDNPHGRCYLPFDGAPSTSREDNPGPLIQSRETQAGEGSSSPSPGSRGSNEVEARRLGSQPSSSPQTTPESRGSQPHHENNEFCVCENCLASLCAHREGIDQCFCFDCMETLFQVPQTVQSLFEDTQNQHEIPHETGDS